MNAPLPEIPPANQKSEGAKTATTTLSLLCCIEVVSLIASTLFFVLFLKPDAMPGVPRAILQGIYAVTIALMGINLFFLWRGFKFARWIYWAFTIMGVLSLPSQMGQTQSIFPGPEKVHFWLGGLFSIAFAIWLALPGASRHFAGERK